MGPKVSERLRCLNTKVTVIPGARPAICDSKIRVVANTAVDGVARIAEVEAWGTAASGAGAINYVLSDIQGSTRAMMSNNGSSSAVIARHDYLPFGEEIGAGLGLRSTSQGYGAADTNRQKYGLTERDDATGLDHTWWRKYENLSGRWTSPDPYNRSIDIADPQSFHRYNYTQNDPVNFIDPSGLLDICFWNIPTNREGFEGDPVFEGCIHIDDFGLMGGGGPAPGGGGGPGPQAQQPPRKNKKCKQGKHGEDRNDVESKLKSAPGSEHISNVRQAGANSKSPEGLIFNIDNHDQYVAALRNSGLFAEDLAINHRGLVGGSVFTAKDFRSYTTGTNTLGPDSTGFTRSLQVTVGKRQQLGGATGYADLDCVNPAQDLVSLAQHNAPIVFRWLTKLF